MTLDLETIQELLKGESKSSKPDGFKKVIQIGPFRYFDKEMTCASRGCRASTFIKLNDIPTCMVHALYELNKMVMDTQGIDTSDCSCKQGQFTKMHSHTEDCPVLKRYRSNVD